MSHLCGIVGRTNSDQGAVVRQEKRKKSTKRRNLALCAVSGKVRFRDHREAINALWNSHNARRFHEGTDRHECRAYQCTSCHGWHLTSQAAPHPLVDPARIAAVTVLPALLTARQTSLPLHLPTVSQDAVSA